MKVLLVGPGVYWPLAVLLSIPFLIASFLLSNHGTGVVGGADWSVVGFRPIPDTPCEEYVPGPSKVPNKMGHDMIVI